MTVANAIYGAVLSALILILCISAHAIGSRVAELKLINIPIKGVKWLNH